MSAVHLSREERALYGDPQRELQGLCDTATGWLDRAEAEIGCGRVVAAVPLIEEAKRLLQQIRLRVPR